ncbi:hypothetical protein QL285_020489 [Trifolium repens]|nr:hypothetical protein QL285_020489 [Trifolium repens]
MVILRDLSNEDERNPPRPLIVGSPLERQVRAHFIRLDGSFNHSGYLSEVLGEPISPRELEGSSGDDSSDSSSENSSDCVIISPSSFTEKRRDGSLALVAVGFEVATMEISSMYDSAESVAEFRKKYDVYGDFEEENVVLEPVVAGETLNVAPTQLSPNSWSFVKAFELICFGLDILDSSVAVFFSFYHIKNTFLRVCGAVGVQNVMYSSEGEPLFPFYWTSNPRLVKGTVYGSLSKFERDTVAYLQSCNQMSPRDLLDAEGAPAVLDKYLKDMSTLTLAQRAQYLEKARARKALAEKGQTDENVEILNQLEIGEVEEKKKKRKGNDARIGIPLKTSSPKFEGGG